jgi:thioredoxin 1
MHDDYADVEPHREEIDGLQGPALVEFGNPGCGWCRGAKPLVDSALADHPKVRHFKIADGRGRPLGRSFKVKLWPTLVFMRDGREVTRLIRPSRAVAIREALAQIDPRQH